MRVVLPCGIPLAIMLSMGAALSADWPQLQHDAQHTGYTADCPEPPWRAAWQRSFAPEMIYPAVQAVIAGGRVFVGTKAGRMRALDMRTGEVLWMWEGAGPILHTAAVDGGRVFFASVTGVSPDGQTAIPGAIYALEAATGALQWSFAAPKGFTAAPLAAERRVFIGGRNGVFYAMDEQAGKPAWTFDAGAPILHTAAYAPPEGNRPGLVIVGSEDIIVYALEAATGKLLWKSEQLYGETLKDFFAVVDGDKVLVRPMSSAVGFASLDVKKDVLEAAFARGKYPEVPEAFQQEVAAGLQRNRFNQELFVLDLATGKEVFQPLVVKCGTLDGPVAPPALDGRGNWVTCYYAKGMAWQTTARLDGATGRVKDIVSDPALNRGNSDENENYSVGGRIVFVMHPAVGGGAGNSVAFDLDKPGKISYPSPRRLPKHAQPAHATNAQTAGNAVSISGNRFFHIDDQSIVYAWTGTEGDQP